MATKNIEPKLRLISEYTQLGNDEAFEIPQYQRAYSWTIAHCSKLWQDIEDFVDSGAEDPYFFGTIIIDCSTQNHLSLIDGQQRTTTFLLLLKALQLCLRKTLSQLEIGPETQVLYIGLNRSYDLICRILYKANDEKLVDMNNNWEYARGVSILENNSINELYKDEFRSIIEAESFDEAEQSVYKIPRKQKDNKYTNFFRNFKYFFESLSDYSESKLNKFASVFLTKCQIIEIKSWQIEQAITMFNSLNSTGMPLSDADIISAQLYSKSGDDGKDIFISEWEHINNLADQLSQEKIVSIDNVLQQFMYVNRARKKQYKTNEVTTPGLRKYYLVEHSELLNNPRELCHSFKEILDIWNIIKDYAVIRLLLKFNENFKLFLISYLLRYEPSKLTIGAVTPIAETLLRLFTVIEAGDAGYSASKFKTFLFNMNFKFVDPSYPISKIIDDFNVHINSTWKREDFERDLKEYSKNVLVYLNEYLYAKDQNRNYNISEKSTNVEHIMPASGHNIDVIRADAGLKDPEEFASIVNLLGNKILLEEVINKTIGNDWFRTKKGNRVETKTGYVGSRFGFALDLAKSTKTVWTKEDILEATDKAADRISDFVFNTES